VSLSPTRSPGWKRRLRFPGRENADSKIFSRLSAWQNWIFQRPNAVGDKGALTLYGKPERPASTSGERDAALREDPQQRQPVAGQALLRALEKWQPTT
jgi:hypothetical protein